MGGLKKQALTQGNAQRAIGKKKCGKLHSKGFSWGPDEMVKSALSLFQTSVSPPGLPKQALCDTLTAVRVSQSESTPSFAFDSHFD
eukprot:COSAG04_NODE_502_length_13354_cov_548.289777_18_plen_86_part_00